MKKTALILNAYLLNSSLPNYQDSVFCVVTAGNAPISGATVTVQRYLSSAYVTVAQLNTSADGCGTIGLDRSVQYQVVAGANGYQTRSFLTVPKTIQYIILSSSSTSAGFSSSLADDSDYVIYTLNPGNPVIDDWVLVNFSVYSINSTLTDWGLTCEYNYSSIYSYINVGSPSGGTSTTNVSTTNKSFSSGGTGNFSCSGFFDRSGYNTTYLNRTFLIYTVNDSFSNISISGGLNYSLGANLSTGFKTALSVILTGVIMAGAANVPWLGGTGAGIIGSFALAGFGFMGWMDWRPILLVILTTLAWIWIQTR